MMIVLLRTIPLVVAVAAPAVLHAAPPPLQLSGTVVSVSEAEAANQASMPLLRLAAADRTAPEAAREAATREHAGPATEPDSTPETAPEAGSHHQAAGADAAAPDPDAAPAAANHHQAAGADVPGSDRDAAAADGGAHAPQAGRAPAGTEMHHGEPPSAVPDGGFCMAPEDVGADTFLMDHDRMHADGSAAMRDATRARSGERDQVGATMHGDAAGTHGDAGAMEHGESCTTAGGDGMMGMGGESTMMHGGSAGDGHMDGGDHMGGADHMGH